MRKNVSGQVVSFQAVSATDGSAVTSGSPTVYYTIDGGTQGTGAGTVTHEGNGQWSYAPTQAETNGNHVAFTFTLSGAISQTVNVYPVSFDPTSSSDLGLTSIAAILEDTGTTIPASLTTIDNEIAVIDANVDAILVDTGTTIPALFPANFAALGINVSGHLSRVTLVDTTTTNSDMVAAPDNATISTINSKLGTFFDVGGYGANLGGNIEAIFEDLFTIDATTGNTGNTVGLISGTVNLILTDTASTIPAQITALNDVSTVEVRAQVDAAIEAYHLDHLLAAAYDPAAKPGNAAGLLNVLVENDGGVPRYTINALEQAPAGGGGGGDGNVTAISGSTAAADTLEAILLNSTTASIAANIVSSDINTVTVSTGLTNSTISHPAGDVFEQTLTIGAITGQTKVIFTIKDEFNVADSQALIQVDSVTGLVISNRESATAANGSITVQNESTGEIDILIEDSEMAKLPLRNNLVWDVVWIDADGDKRTKSKGTFNNQWTVTKATS